MKRVPPPIDAHAHIDADIGKADLRALGAFVFAVTRSLDEYDKVESRRDGRVIWGVGVHPGLVGVQKKFEVNRFRELIQGTLLVGEVGLDGASRVPLSDQIQTFRSVLEILQITPRLVSVHSNGAQLHVLRELHRTPVEGVILHWWTGSPELTTEAVRLGCYFSLPPALMSSDILGLIPNSRLLTETDHPFGDRRTPGKKAPGQVAEVEQRLGKLMNKSPLEAREQIWRNFRRLVDQVGVRDSLGNEWKATLDHLD